MGKLSEYKTLEEKAAVFNVKMLSTKSDIDTFISDFKENRSDFWRGVSQAKYKLYSSLQRYWVENDLKDDKQRVREFIAGLCGSSLAWQGSVLARYFQKAHKESDPSIYSLLSILRHHNAPTPMSDWSRNPLIALYFASDYPTVESGSDIDNYASVYQVHSRHPWVINTGKENFGESEEYGWLKSVIERDPAKLKELCELLDIEARDIANIPLLSRRVCERVIAKYTDEMNGAAVRIEDGVNDPFEWGINNNLHIINQEGVFIYHIDPIRPLDESSEALLESFALRPESETTMRTPEERKLKAKQIKQEVVCYTFHRRLVPYVRAILHNEPFGLTKDYVFPNMFDMAKFALNRRETSNIDN